MTAASDCISMTTESGHSRTICNRILFHKNLNTQKEIHVAHVK